MHTYKKSNDLEFVYTLI